MLRKATALPLCSVTDIPWYRCVVSSGSLVIAVIRFPRSSMYSADCGHQAPLVPIATGTKECVAARATYFVVLLTPAFSVAAQTVVEVSCRCDDAYLSGTVTSKRAIYHESTGPESLHRAFYRQPSIVRWVPCLPESVPY